MEKELIHRLEQTVINVKDCYRVLPFDYHQHPTLNLVVIIRQSVWMQCGDCGKWRLLPSDRSLMEFWQLCAQKLRFLKTLDVDNDPIFAFSTHDNNNTTTIRRLQTLWMQYKAVNCKQMFWLLDERSCYTHANASSKMLCDFWGGTDYFPTTLYQTTTVRREFIMYLTYHLSLHYQVVKHPWVTSANRKATMIPIDLYFLTSVLRQLGDPLRYWLYPTFCERLFYDVLGHHVPARDESPATILKRVQVGVFRSK